MESLREFERNAIAALAASDPDREAILEQLASASCSSREYSGVGVFTNLLVQGAASKIRSTSPVGQGELAPTGEHPNVPAGIGFLLWLEDGRISCLESYTYDGSRPLDESLIRVST